jgi:hypothetical protein
VFAIVLAVDGTDGVLASRAASAFPPPIPSMSFIAAARLGRGSLCSKFDIRYLDSNFVRR